MGYSGTCTFAIFIIFIVIMTILYQLMGEAASIFAILVFLHIFCCCCCCAPRDPKEGDSPDEAILQVARVAGLESRRPFDPIHHSGNPHFQQNNNATALSPWSSPPGDECRNPPRYSSFNFNYQDEGQVSQNNMASSSTFIVNVEEPCCPNLAGQYLRSTEDDLLNSYFSNNDSNDESKPNAMIHRDEEPPPSYYEALKHLAPSNSGQRS